MANHQIIALLLIVAGVGIVGLLAYYNGRHDGERRGTVKAALAIDHALELQQQLQQEQQQRTLLADELTQLARDHHRLRSDSDALTQTSRSLCEQLEESERKRREIDDENERLNASLAAERGQVDDLEQALHEKTEQIAAFRHDIATAANALDITVEQLKQAEARALLPADAQHLQHAARQLAQHAAQFRRSGSQKVNHAQVASANLQTLLQRLQPTQQQSEEPSPRRAA